MTYHELLETRFNGFIKNKNLLGAIKCVEDLFGVKPHIASGAVVLVYKKGLPLVEAVDQCVIKDFKEGKI